VCAQAKSASEAGGKTFPLERMLAIFEAIIGEKHEYAAQSIDVQMQVRLSLPSSPSFAPSFPFPSSFLSFASFPSG
jgi:hypothetical protein